MFFKESTKKSFKWLLAELSVVVLGILIAFQIDNYREYLDQRDEERLVLAELLIDLKEDQARIDDAVAAKTAQLKGIDGFIGFLNKEARTPEDYAHSFRPILRNRGYFPIDHTFEGLQANGRVFLISDKELAKALLKHYDRTRPLLLGVQEVIGNYWAELRTVSSADVFFSVPGLPNEKYQTVIVDNQYSLAVTMPVDHAPRNDKLVPLLGNMRASITNYLNLSRLLKEESQDIEAKVRAHLEQL